MKYKKVYKQYWKSKKNSGNDGKQESVPIFSLPPRLSLPCCKFPIKVLIFCRHILCTLYEFYILFLVWILFWLAALACTFTLCSSCHVGVVALRGRLGEPGSSMFFLFFLSFFHRLMSECSGHTLHDHHDLFRLLPPPPLAFIYTSGLLLFPTFLGGKELLCVFHLHKVIKLVCLWLSICLSVWMFPVACCNIASLRFYQTDFGF